MISLDAYKKVLAAVDRSLKNAAETAFRQLLDRIKAGESPQAAMTAIMESFNMKAVDGLEQAFSKVLQSSLGTQAMKDWKIGDVTLSQRLYHNAQSVAAIAKHLIEQHTQALHAARDLAKTLYEGYDFKDDPLHATYPLPKYLKDQFDRAQAARLKTPALRAAYLKAIDKANDADLKNALKVAFYERNRYFASRIARTELHRAYTDQQAHDLMQQSRVEYVQIRLSSKHPKTDICDLHSRLNKYGLGAGIYPKADAPKPPFHPHCYCLLSPKIDLINPTSKERENAERSFLSRLPIGEASRIAGSREKLQRILKGKVSLEDVFNEGKPEAYKWMRVGDVGQDARMENDKRFYSGNRTPSVAGGMDIRGEDSVVLTTLGERLASTRPEWFPRGLRSLTIKPMDEGYAETLGIDQIVLSSTDKERTGFVPAHELVQALAKIKAGNSLEFAEEYAVEILWHEMNHLQATGLKKSGRLVETVIQFVSRHTYHNLLQELGGAPSHQAAIIENGYAYTTWVANFRSLLAKQGIIESTAVDPLALLLKNANDETIGPGVAQWLASQGDGKISQWRKALSQLDLTSADFLRYVGRIWFRGYSASGNRES